MAAAVRAELAAARLGGEDLRRQLADIAESTVAVPDDEHDAEGSTIGFERARVGALLAHTERRIADLEVAVGRLLAGTYQRCERCRGDIAGDRLEALPATRLCVACAGLVTG